MNKALCLYRVMIGMVCLPTITFADTRILDFDVFLDGDPMGTHRYTLTTSGTGPDERVHVISEATYQVKVLFVTAWRYEHRSEETWLGGCLRAIESTTDDNGKAFHVSGTTTADGLALMTQDGPKRYQGCTRTFAYWHPDLANAVELMNAQTGKVEPVTVEALPARAAPQQSTTSNGTLFGLRGKDIHIDVWHDEQGRWFALSSRTPEGRSIEYVLRPSQGVTPQSATTQSERP